MKQQCKSNKVKKQRKCESFAIELPELHCCVYVLMLQRPSDFACCDDGPWAGVLSKLRDDVQSLGLADKTSLDSQKMAFDEINSRLEECQDNPAFTFQWSPTEVVVVLKLECFDDESDAGFFGTAIHELNHAVTMVFEPWSEAR